MTCIPRAVKMSTTMLHAMACHHAGHDTQLIVSRTGVCDLAIAIVNRKYYTYRYSRHIQSYYTMVVLTRVVALAHAASSKVPVLRRADGTAVPIPDNVRLHLDFEL